MVSQAGLPRRPSHTLLAAGPNIRASIRAHHTHLLPSRRHSAEEIPKYTPRVWVRASADVNLATHRLTGRSAMRAGRAGHACESNRIQKRVVYCGLQENYRLRRGAAPPPHLAETKSSGSCCPEASPGHH